MSFITFPRMKQEPTPQMPEMELSEWDIIPTIISENPMSFGKDFNLIRAVAEHAPQRVEQIIEELDTLRFRMQQLQDEKETLTRLIAALEG